ncbi:DUF3320 domain-containing protein [Paracoccus sanguinis]|uniref:AAA domain-containing protein n=1 Tax=Paracoccus sanguinis TaxID=1545044 RepID=A0A1H2W0D6_9RHOB|nr:DUF3320 domain-containing protein [Paracoccus sanguinis]SDW74070.1 AAA domain-containing protein [Paracoccus sanguinis]
MGDDTGAMTASKPPAAAPEILVKLAPNVTFASQQNDVAVLADLVITNPTDCDLDDLVLKVSAEPPVIGPRSWTFDRIDAGSVVRPRDRHLPLSGGFLDRLTDKVRANVRFELRQGEALLAETDVPLTALARHEWGGSVYVPELLAAFVTPNDPAVDRLLKAASEVLRAAGKPGALDGYQSGSRTRAWELAAAIWSAVAARGLSYAVPPASFETTGQKVRLPSDVEASGLATCLDTALLFAGCYEQVGLHPIVVFTKGHAFAGAWLQPQHLPGITTDDPQVLRKALSLNELVLFETTLATADHPVAFSKAVAEAGRQLAEERDAEFALAIDIRQARRRGIGPLPQLAAGVSGDVDAEPVRRAPTLEVAPELPGFDLDDRTQDDAPQTPQERLDRWKRDLLDLSKRNRLLNLRSGTTAIPLFCPDPAKLEDLIAEGKHVALVAAPQPAAGVGQVDATLRLLRTGDDHDEEIAREALERRQVIANTDAKTLEKGAIELYRKAKADLEEGGSNTLFLALGTLRWSPSNDHRSHYRAPMILLPVRLERTSAKTKPYLKGHEDDPVFNLTLLEMLKQDFGIDMPDLAGELPSDGSGVDVKRVWDLVRHRIKDVPGFEVVPEVVLSTFSFAKYLMWRDLSERTETLKRTPFVRHLIDTPREPYAGGAGFVSPCEIDVRVDPAELLAPLHADSSQIVAIHASGGDGDFVLEGPPGTGKSETIGNIIAHNLGLGRKVLFVSEKMAALDVVHRRLAKAGLGDLCLELHSAKANKKGVLQQLDRAWRSREVLSQESWEAKARELKRARDKLNGFVAALHTPGPAGVSARDAIARLSRWGDLHMVELDWPRTQDELLRVRTPDVLTGMVETARSLGRQFSQITPEDVEVFAGVGHTDWSNAWRDGMSVAARALDAAVTELVSARAQFFQRLGMEADEVREDEVSALADLARLIPACEATDLSFALKPDARETFARLRDLGTALGAYRDRRGRLPSAFAEDRIAGQPVESWITERDEARSRNILFRGSALRALRTKLGSAYGLAPGQVEMPEDHLEALRDLARDQAALKALEADLPPGTPWRSLATETARLNDAVEQGDALRAAVTRYSALKTDPVTARSHLTQALCENRDLLEPGGPADAAAKRVTAAAEEFGRTLTAWREAIKSPAGDGSAVPLAQIAAEARAVADRDRRLNVWCAWAAAKREAETAGLRPLVVALEAGRVSHDMAHEAMLTAYCRWAAPLLIDASEPLRRFSGLTHEAMIAEFQRLDAELAEMTAGHIRAKLSAGVPSRNSPTAGPGFGVLSREIQKQARHLPVRKLVAQMGPSLTTLTPCLLMSPLSVAQFLPAETSLFDLVVFDEASQITVYDAVGAIARGRRCVIVGDPKQMPPTNFFAKAPGDDDGDGSVDTDLDSILDEALAARVPLHRLTGHYRSRHESLIAFSNHAYYDGELVTYPAADTRDTVVSLRKVAGTYGRGRGQTNPEEAKAVVAEVVARLRDPARQAQSLGVVTLNAKQQELILNLLDDERRRDPALERFFGDAAPEPVFVKNLETVQGDQRDVILLSITFGPTEPDSPTMSMNFGPLNGKGGQRRLNVAITRATSEVMIFASFDPSMIDLTRTSAEAMRDLKHYLEFAQRGPAALMGAVRNMGGTAGYDSDFEMAVAEALRARGWTVRTQVGASKFRIDLGVVHPDAPGSFLAGVECDGATYHASPSARDRDRVRHIIRETLGWRLARVWSTDWFNDRETVLERLDARLRELLDEDRARAAREDAERAAEEMRRTEVAAAAVLPDSVPAGSHDQSALIEPSASADEVPTPPPEMPLAGDDGQPVDPSVITPPTSLEPLERIEPLAAGRLAAASRDPAQFHNPSYRTILTAMAAEIISQEGPVTFKRLSDLIAREHGFKRTGKAISSTVWTAIKHLGPRTRASDGHEVFWPEAAAPQEIIAFRGLRVAGRNRDWNEVPLPEKLGLIRSLADVGYADLPRAVGSAIGYKRLTESFKTEVARLSGAVKGQS